MRHVQNLLEVGRVKTGIAMSLILTFASPSLMAKPKIFEIIENGLTGILHAQLNKLTDGFDLVKDQLNVEKRIESLTEESMHTLNAKISGSYDMGKLMNDAKEQAARRWSPGDLFQPSSNKAYSELEKAHNRKYDFEREHGFGIRQESIKTVLNDRDKIQRSSLVSAQYTTQRIDENITKVENLMGQIDSAENQKAATDLNSRIQSQVALELVELKRLSALQLQALGSLSQDALLDQQGSAQFNRWV